MKDIQKEAQHHIETTENQIAADEAVLNIDPRFAAAHYGHDLYPTNDKVDQSGADELSDTDILMIADHYGVPMNATVGKPNCGNFLAAAREIIARSASTQPAPVTEQEPIATVKVTNNGYGMMLSTYVAYALPEGFHDLYATPQPFPAPAVQEPIGQIRTDIERACAIWFGTLPPNGTMIYAAPTQAIAQTAPAVAGEAMQPCMVELQDELWRAHAKKVLSDVRQVIKDDALHGAFADGFDCAIDEIKHRLFAAPSQGAKQ